MPTHAQRPTPKNYLNAVPPSFLSLSFFLQHISPILTITFFLASPGFYYLTTISFKHHQQQSASSDLVKTWNENNVKTCLTSEHTESLLRPQLPGKCLIFLFLFLLSVALLQTPSVCVQYQAPTTWTHAIPRFLTSSFE